MSAYGMTKMREEIKDVYPSSSKWAKRVNLMLPDQVTAVYLSLKKQNKIKN